MQHTLPIFIEYMTSQDWAMNLFVLEQMADIVERHCRGERMSGDYIRTVTAQKNEKGSDQREFEFIEGTGTAVIPISGIIAKYSRMVNGVSLPRGTSVEQVISQLEQAREDPRVESIFLHIESPGGNVDGVADLAQRIYEISFEKPITAFADDTANSAAYWLGSQANVFYATQMADVGSIGVYTLYMDSSKAAEKEGLKFYIFRSGPHKGAGSIGIEITEENREKIQERIESKFEIFLTAVLRGRTHAGLNEKALRELADGRAFVGAEAVENKLVDGIMTLEEALSAEPPAVRDQTNVAAAKRQRITASSSSVASEELAEVRRKAIAEGMNVTEAKAKAFDLTVKASKERENALQQKLDEANEKLQAVTFVKTVEKYQDEGLSKADAFTKAARQLPKSHEAWKGSKMTIKIDDGQAGTYAKAVQKYQDKGLSKAEAFTRAAKELPKSHEAWKGSGITTNTDDGKAETYIKAVEKYQDRGLTKAEAYTEAAKELPKSHEAWKGSKDS